MAYVPDEVNLWPNLSGGEAIDLLGRLRGGIDYRRRDELIEDFQFDPTKKFRTYSKGNRQKAAVIAALASDAELYIMDEPTGGLDPLMESVFQQHILNLRRDGKTVLFSSHVLAEVEKMCDRVTIIRDGRTVEAGALDELRHLGRMFIKAETERPVVDMDRLSGLSSVQTEGTSVEFQVDNDELEGAIKHLMDFGIKSFVSNPPTLGDVFMRHYDDAEGGQERVER